MPTSKTVQVKNENPHRGGAFDDFLAEEGILAEVEAASLKRAFALAVADEMRKQRLKKSDLSKRMRTSRAALDRLLDPDNSSVTLATLSRAAQAIGRKLNVKLEPS